MQMQKKRKVERLTEEEKEQRRRAYEMQGRRMRENMMLSIAKKLPEVCKEVLKVLGPFAAQDRDQLKSYLERVHNVHPKILDKMSIEDMCKAISLVILEYEQGTRRQPFETFLKKKLHKYLPDLDMGMRGGASIAEAIRTLNVPAVYGILKGKGLSLGDIEGIIDEHYDFLNDHQSIKGKIILYLLTWYETHQNVTADPEELVVLVGLDEDEGKFIREARPILRQLR
jgi:hypothetical protein